MSKKPPNYTNLQILPDSLFLSETLQTTFAVLFPTLTLLLPILNSIVPNLTLQLRSLVLQ